MIFVSLWACLSQEPIPDDYLVVSQEQQSSWTQNFNPFLASGLSRWPTNAGVYEPLMIYSPLQGRYVPWLATQFQWNENATTLSFRIRNDVQWSDGHPFTPDDVVFTFSLMQENPALDTRGIWDKLSAVERQPEDWVQFSFSEPFASGLDALAHQFIVPKHIWSNIADPIDFANPQPVGTGPYTEILHFGAQQWDLGRNPHYWQDLESAPKALRFPAFPSNEQAALALLKGEVDWAGNFLPAIDRIYVGRDEAHHHYWFPLVGTSVLLYPNHHHPLLKDVRVRKAISHALDRKKIVEIAMHDYTAPAPVTGLSPAYGTWKTPAEDWTEYDIDRAKELLTEAGYTFGDDDILLDPNKKPVSLTLSVVSGWSDWVRAAQVISQQLSDIGIQTRVEGRDFGAWFSRLQKGEFDVSLGWSTEGPTPQGFYGDLMSAKKIKPVGEAATVNWHRFSDPVTDELLMDFERTPHPQQQKAILQKLQDRFIEQAPAIPLFLNPSWGECNSKRFIGWPSAENPYARLSPNNPPETLLVMTRIRAR
ncbi:MAG: ABC transporter substrate-binding protein [Myxococcota bacterium]|nr:ABC transporter substrate-binding protein [Myxococcota bacterium]